MSAKLWKFTIFASFAVLAMAAQASTSTYDALYVFGDSYCDVGNLFAATGDTYPPAPYYKADSRTAPSGSITWPASFTCPLLRRFLAERTTPLAEHGRQRHNRLEPA